LFLHRLLTFTASKRVRRKMKAIEREIKVVNRHVRRKIA